MSTAKQEILRRIREATRDVTEPDPAVDTPVEWVHGQPLPTPDVLADFVAKVEDYSATVFRTYPDQVGHAIVEALHALGADSVVLPGGLDADWRTAVEESGLQVHSDDPPLTAAELDGIDAVVTGSAVSMADSGTIALDHGPGQGRRALTLVPDSHVCVVRSSSVVSDVPEGIVALSRAIRNGNPVTWISGGSATSDIELSRVEGVHGPRHLYVVLVED